uniref:ATP synthase F0 subunit 8 n=1 Tax=Chrysopetalum debile TaxID=115833 RepID=UPI001EDCE2D7|nr:ATP synthase F0 subunit 8 [Chrysopetalum debile]UJV31480.1 ATP synthase F0 subunit 8 [Chrysopetalum debile]
MPHLSPISWALIPIMFYLAFLTFVATYWWHSTPSLNFTSSQETSATLMWIWH